MEYNISVDSDSILFKVCWRNKDEPKQYALELAYFDFCGEIAKIKSAVFKKFPYTKGDTVNCEIVFSKKLNFRHDIYPEYKANRKPTALGEFSKELKELIKSRLPDIVEPIGAEADDWVVSRAKINGWMVAAIDKDIIGVCPAHCYNYNKDLWTNPVKANKAEETVLMQAITGDSGDGIPGVKGTGKVGAQKFMTELLAGRTSKEAYSNLFGSKENCELMNQLVRMDQWNHETGELTLWTIEDWSLVTDLEIEQGVF